MISSWGSPFFLHVNTHAATFSGVPDYIHEAIVRAYIKTAIYKPLDDEILNQIVHPWTEEGGKPTFYRQIAQAISSFTDEIQPLYESISRLVLILWGEEDTWIPLEKGQTLNRMIPDSQFYAIPDAGHLVIEEQPDLLIERIRSSIQAEARS